MKIVPAHVGIDPVVLSEILNRLMLYPELIDTEPEIFNEKTAGHLVHKLAKYISTQGKNITLTPEVFKIISANSLETLDCESEKRFEDVRYVGELLFNVWRIDKARKSGSVNKGVYITDNSHDISASYIRKAWSKYKSVAHICTAHYVLHSTFGTIMHVNIKNIKLTDELYIKYVKEIATYYLSLIMYFYDYATNKIDTRSKKPLLDPVDTWIYQREIIHGVAEPEINAPLSDKEIELLSCYLAKNTH